MMKLWLNIFLQILASITKTKDNFPIRIINRKISLLFLGFKYLYCFVLFLHNNASCSGKSRKEVDKHIWGEAWGQTCGHNLLIFCYFLLIRGGL